MQDNFTTPIINMLEKEHQNMFDRTRSLDTRASFLFSVKLSPGREKVSGGIIFEEN